MQRRILAQDGDLAISVGPTVQTTRCWSPTSTTPAGTIRRARRAFGRRDDDLEAVATAEGGAKLDPRAPPATRVREPMRAVQRRARRQRTHSHRRRCRRPRAARGRTGRATACTRRTLVAIAHPGQVLLSSAAHDALAAGAQTGWAAGSLGRFTSSGSTRTRTSINSSAVRLGLPTLRVDRLPPPGPAGVERSVQGYELRELIGAGQLGEVHRAYQSSVGQEVGCPFGGHGVPSRVRAPLRDGIAADHTGRAPTCRPLLDYWREPDRAVMVSRLVTGGNLAERIPPGGFDPAQALEWRTRSARRWPPPTATAWRTDGCDRRTCCSTRRQRVPGRLGIDEICRE